MLFPGKTPATPRPHTHTHIPQGLARRKKPCPVAPHPTPHRQIPSVLCRLGVPHGIPKPDLRGKLRSWARPWGISWGCCPPEAGPPASTLAVSPWVPLTPDSKQSVAVAAWRTWRWWVQAPPLPWLCPSVSLADSQMLLFILEQLTAYLF